MLRAWRAASERRKCGRSRSAAPSTAWAAPPAARITVSPTRAQTGQTVAFDATGSSVADGTVVLYEWDLDGDEEFDDSSEVEEERILVVAGDEDRTVPLASKRELAAG